MNIYKKAISITLILVFTSTLISAEIDKVVVWGHLNPGHTHHWIHYAYNRTFKHMGYKTHWLPDEKNKSFDFSNTLFFVSGLEHKNIPLRKDCRYILHNCQMNKYKSLFEQGNCIILQVYTHDVLERNVLEIDDLTYLDFERKVVYMPWATDLLPHEINEIKKQLQKNPPKKERSVHYVGSVGHDPNPEFSNVEPITRFSQRCNELGINFNIHRRIPMEENIKLVQQSIIAPAIQSPWQCRKGYIPCRILKNISYGQMPATNSETVYTLLKEKVIYNSDTSTLVDDALKRASNLTQEELFELMDLVRDKHTYINRIKVLLNFLDTFKPLNM
jgi:hypothetical protein